VTKNLTAVFLSTALVVSVIPRVALANNACRDLFSTGREPVFVPTKETQEAEHTRLFSDFELASPGGQAAFKVSSSETTGGYFNRITFRSRQLFLTDEASPAVKKIVTAFKTELGIDRFDRRLELIDGVRVHRPDARGYEIGEVIERVGGGGSSLDVPLAAMKSDEALTRFLGDQLNLLRERAIARERDLTTASIARFATEDAALLSRAFLKHHIHTRIDNLGPDVRGDAFNNTIRLNESFISHPAVIGTAVHEMTHTTTDRKLTTSAKPAAVGRAISYARYPDSRDSRLWGLYKHDGYRTDEYEARLREVAYLKLKGLAHEVLKTERVLKVFHEVEIDDCTRALVNFDKSKSRFIESAGPYGMLQIYFGDIIVNIPIPSQAYAEFAARTGGDRLAYAKMIIEERLKYLKSKDHSY
jgi:hypothetical protein